MTTNATNFTGLPSLEALWQVQQQQGSDGFYGVYGEATDTAQTVIQGNLDLLTAQINQLKELVEPFDDADTLVNQLRERVTFLDKTLGEISNTTRIVNSTLGAYGDASKMVQTLEKGGFAQDYIVHRKEELGLQNKELNTLLIEFSRYAQTLLDALNNETKTAQRLQAEEAITDVNHSVLMALYQSWLERSFAVNKLLEARLVFISGLLESLRKDLTSLQVHKMEQDVQERARQVAARRYKAKVEDVTDYDDLEGQYRHRYDEEGNLIGIEEGGQGGNRRGWQVVIVSAIIVAAIIAYFVLKG
ncbi:hypothetical protein [Veillonella criceti]|uniref:Uncharacterized protein n=1 Tax=Veillonella criceti TaxID=103891 RepID=A0A380NPC4_9FIRM|nr:hypothetical protein [Veillonella criceti]SUP44937.1 Uncharacterised protein [Veillonella criceti]